jgi:DNA-directed RNA polymerase subunit RPC12/RpoP
MNTKPLHKEDHLPHCPWCGSDEVAKEKLSKVAFAAGILLLGIPLPFFSLKYYCFDCSREFSKKDLNEITNT